MDTSSETESRRRQVNKVEADEIGNDAGLDGADLTSGKHHWSLDISLFCIFSKSETSENMKMLYKYHLKILDYKM